MKCIVAGHIAVTATEFAELALGFAERSAGFDVELFTGTATESEQERAARLDVARDVLAELREVDPVAAAYARELLKVSDLPKLAPRPRRARKGRRPAVCGAQGLAVAA
ncbi:hypothetical protein ABZ837_29195 [Streptomyces sp. NPDC047197]|uniref:hypothetical protein n=1 Tax=Streptomyces sp. NPDC047197 TaxID=3155477 RepID=UPI0033E075AA